MNDQSLGRTGRTTRMLQHAGELAAAGKRVLIVSSTYSQAVVLQATFNTLFPGLSELVSFHTASRLEQESGLRLDEFNLLRHSASNIEEVLVDHYAFESRYRWVLSEMHRWDSAQHQGQEGAEVTKEPDKRCGTCRYFDKSNPTKPSGKCMWDSRISRTVPNWILQERPHEDHVECNAWEPAP